jgi:hypothetical protein
MKGKRSKIEEYLHRNDVLAKTYGALAIVDMIANREGKKKHPVKWIMSASVEAQMRLWAATKELSMHRQEIYGDRHPFVIRSVP